MRRSWCASMSSGRLLGTAFNSYSAHCGSGRAREFGNSVDAPAAPVFAGMPAPTGTAPGLGQVYCWSLWERARPRSRQLGGWHRLRRCSRACPLLQGPRRVWGRFTAGRCGSGRAREAGNSVGGTGCAGVRGHARSYRDRSGPGAGLLLVVVRAGAPAKQATRWLAPAAPVFAGMPAPTGTAPGLGQVYCWSL